MSTAIVWFRRDLRLADQPALSAAVAAHDRVIPLYVHAPDEEGEWAPGAAQRWWLHHALQALADSLARAGAPLTIRRGPAGQALADLIDETNAEAVYWNRLYEPEAIERDRRIKGWLRERGITAESFNAAVLYEPWQVETGQGQPYRVFTPFWKRISGYGLPDAVEPTPPTVPGPNRAPETEWIDALELRPRIRWDAGLEAAWTPGEAGAHARLDTFSREILGDYDTLREQPSLAGTSALSPHLHFGEIGPRQVVRALRDRGLANHRSAAVFLSELGWRDFAHHLLFHFPQTPTRPLNERFEAFPWRDPADDEARADLDAWKAGATGIPLVDAGMRQLWHTGWMHNRLRMVVASFLTKNLRLHWLEGARWFWDTLVDADLASNTLGWQWAGGCGADAAPYFRIFNPVRQGERFDPGGAYVRHWVPEIAALPDRYIHAPWQAPANVLDAAGIALDVQYPRPVVDLKASRRAALDAFQTIKDSA